MQLPRAPIFNNDGIVSLDSDVDEIDYPRSKTKIRKRDKSGDMDPAIDDEREE